MVTAWAPYGNAHAALTDDDRALPVASGRPLCVLNCRSEKRAGMIGNGLNFRPEGGAVGSTEKKKVMTIEQWLDRELAKLPPLTPEKSARIADIVIAELPKTEQRTRRAD